MASVDVLSKEKKQQLYSDFGVMEASHTIGVLNFSISIVVASRFPQFFWIVHLAKAFIYLPWRFVRFRRKGWELYLLDFCYANTYCTVLCCILTFLRVFCGVPNPLHPYNHYAIRVGFAFANGALLLAIPLYNNKLVFHDVDNTLSLYIHWSPAVFLWTLRWGGGYGTPVIEDWWPGMFQVCPDMHAGGCFHSFLSLLWCTDCQGTITESVKEFVLYPALAWLAGWGLPYALVVFCCLWSWIEREGKGCLYKDTLNSKDMIGRFVNAAPEQLKPLAWLGVHLVWTVLTGGVSIILWNSFVLHTIYMGCVLTYAVHNGSKFMFRYVAAKQIPGQISKLATPEDPSPAQPFLND